MASIMKRVLGSIKKTQAVVTKKEVQSVPAQENVNPPSPDLSALSPEELQILNDVFRRQTEFEEDEIKRIERIRKELVKYEEMIRSQCEVKKRVKHVDLRLCKLCFKTKFADGIGRICYDCHKRVCGRCGSFTRPRWNVKKNKSVRGKWRCNMCQLKRETLCKTGQWYGGAQTPSGQVMLTKTGFYGTETESDVSSSRLANLENDNERIPLGNLTDSELIRSIDSARNADELSPKRFRRRSLPVPSREKSFDEDEDDLDDNEEELQRERLLFRQKRQQRKWRRRYLPDNYRSEESTIEMTSDTLFSSGLSSEERKRPKLKGRYRSLPKLQLTKHHHSKSKVSSDSMTDDSSALSYIGKESSLSDCTNSPVLYKMHRQDAVYCSSSSSLADINGSTSSPLPPRHTQSRVAAFRAVQSCCYNIASKEELLSRRVTLSQCQNIEICQNSAFSGVVSTAAGNPHEVILHKDASDPSRRTKGLGMRVVGGQESDNGEMGAFVTMVIKGGPADVQGGIKEADQILEVDGQSLVGVTFEEARDILDKTGNVVQLVVIHQVQNMPPPASAEKGVLKTGVSFAMASPPVNKPRRRMLPPTPIEIKKIIRKVSGRVQAKINYSAIEQLLEVILIKGEDIGLPEGSKRTPKPFAMVHLLPQRSLFDYYETEGRDKTRNPVFDVTYTYDDIDEREVRGMSVEITIWSQQVNGDVFVGEVLLDLKDHIPTEPIWYDLQDHDENSSPLPDRKTSMSDISEADMLIGSRGMPDRQLSVHRSLPSTPSCEHPSKPFARMPTVIGQSSTDRGSPAPSPVNLPEVSFNPEKRQSLSKKMRHRMSIAVSKVSLSLSTNDKKDSGTSDSNSIRKLSRGSSIGESDPASSPKTRKLSNVNIEMLAPPLPLSSRRSSNSSYKSEQPSECDDEILRNLPETPDKPDPDGLETPSMLGPGQLTPSPSSEGDLNVYGDVKLGFVITKGQLEVDIYCARNLNQDQQGPPDTYVKTYLVEGKKTIQKKKTSLIKSSSNPQYRSKIKYSAANVHGRHMRVTIWEKSKGFDKKIFIGETIVKLDSLDLSQHNMAWYKLFKQNAANLGSNESLHW